MTTWMLLSFSWMSVRALFPAATNHDMEVSQVENFLNWNSCGRISTVLAIPGDYRGQCGATVKVKMILYHPHSNQRGYVVWEIFGTGTHVEEFRQYWQYR